MANWFRDVVRRMCEHSALSNTSKDLDGVYLVHRHRLVQAIKEGPVVIAANHVGWWDGPVLVALNTQYQVNGAFVMDAEQLGTYPFFRSVGAIPIDRSSRSSSRTGLQAARDHLREAGDVLWVFPQGEHTPIDRRPLGLKGGIRLIVRNTDARILPVAIRYRWQHAQVPQCWLHFGEPIHSRGRELMDDLEQALTTGLSALDSPSDHAASLIPPRDRPVPVMTKLLGWIWNRVYGDVEVSNVT